MPKFSEGCEPAVRDDTGSRAAAAVPPDRPGLLSRNRLIPIVMASALFMDLMDSSSLALALPTIAKQFAVPTPDLRLALTAYAVTVATLVPVSGWIASRFGARRVFLCAMGTFVIGSLLCGIADGVTQLILSRILQGMGGAMMTPVGRAIMVGSVDRSAMVRAMAWYTLPAILAPLLGPPMAGLLIELASWRWIFFVNLPVGVIGVLAVLRFVPRSLPEPRRSFDVVGFLLCAANILGLMALVETGVFSGQPAYLRIAALAGLSALSAIYVRQALRSPAPLIDLRVLRHPTLRITLASGWLQRIGVGAIMLVLPMQLQLGLGLSPLVASQVPAAGAVGSILSRIACPIGLKLMEFRTLMIGCTLVLAVATLLPIRFDATTSVALMCGFMAFYALIRASFFMAGNALSYADVEGLEIGHASVLFSISQQLSLGLGFTLGGTIVGLAGGATSLSAYAAVYLAIALLPLGAAMIVWRMPRGVGEQMRQDVSA